MSSETLQSESNRLGIYGAIIVIAAIPLSGPGGVLLVALTHPQPRWESAQKWAQNYHSIQAFPFLAGIFLIVGLVLMLSAVCATAEAPDKHRATAALVFLALFGALISFNYLVQTTYLPALAHNYRTAMDPIIEALSMDRPESLCWAIEMWGYGFLGIATWLAASSFRRTRVERAAAGLFVLNGIGSVAGACATAISPSWVISRSGLFFYVFWNVLMLAIAVLVWIGLKQRLAAIDPASEHLSSTSASRMPHG